MKELWGVLRGTVRTDSYRLFPPTFYATPVSFLHLDGWQSITVRLFRTLLPRTTKLVKAVARSIPGPIRFYKNMVLLLKRPACFCAVFAVAGIHERR